MMKYFVKKSIESKIIGEVKMKITISEHHNLGYLSNLLRLLHRFEIQNTWLHTWAFVHILKLIKVSISLSETFPLFHLKTHFQFPFLLCQYLPPTPRPTHMDDIKNASPVGSRQQTFKVTFRLDLDLEKKLWALEGWNMQISTLTNQIQAWHDHS